jgi:hypothetical protein
MRQFLFGLRQTALNGADPYAVALQIKRDGFDQAFEQYLRKRFAESAGQPSAERFDHRATVRIEGDIIAMNSSVPVGFACIELWVLTEGGIRRRWAVECGGGMKPDVMRVLKLGDRVIVSGPPARSRDTQRMFLQSLVRPSDGFTWRAQSE